jgi:hypothetical protein
VCRLVPEEKNMDTGVLDVPTVAHTPSATHTLDVIRALAKRAGMSVERWQPDAVPKGYAGPEQRWRKTLRINGRTCLVRHAGRLARSYGKDRIILYLSLHDLKLAEFLILYVDVPGYAARSYVLPTAVAREILHERKKKRKRFSVPLVPPSRVMYGTIVWEKCRGAWHLLCMN